MSADLEVDAIIIGGGFYGAVIAIYLARNRGLKHIILIEREAGLLKRASYNNQARVHNGYHYPRSLITAYRSKINMPRFMQDWAGAVKRDFTMLYAIPRHNSKVTPKQFVRFCKEIGAKIEPADLSSRQLFASHFIEDVFQVEEYAFDSDKLSSWALNKLNESGVEVFLDTSAFSISSGDKSQLMVAIRNKNGIEREIASHYVFNCAYSGLNQLSGDFPGTTVSLKHEIAEIALIYPPPSLSELGITVMDGPFFSMMPFPARGLGLHTLSHVRYTPHMHWNDQHGIDPYMKLNDYNQETRVDRMVRDAGRYLPALLDSKHIDSLFEIKTVLAKNEGDDGRPILFEKHAKLPGCYSVLGGKIDNIYDVLEKLEGEQFT